VSTAMSDIGLRGICDFLETVILDSLLLELPLTPGAIDRSVDKASKNGNLFVCLATTEVHAKSASVFSFFYK